MTHTIINCDVCGVRDAVTHHFYTDRKMDPTAGLMENIYESIDLCFTCSRKAYYYAELKHGRELGSYVYQRLKALPKHHLEGK